MAIDGLNISNEGGRNWVPHRCLHTSNNLKRVWKLWSSKSFILNQTYLKVSWNRGDPQSSSISRWDCPVQTNHFEVPPFVESPIWLFSLELKTPCPVFAGEVRSASWCPSGWKVLSGWSVKKKKKTSRVIGGTLPAEKKKELIIIIIIIIIINHYESI